MAITPQDRPNQFMFTALPFEGLINMAHRDKQIKDQQNMQMAAQMGQFEGKIASSKHLANDNDMYKAAMSGVREEMGALVDRHKDGFHTPEAIKDYYSTTSKIANDEKFSVMAYNYEKLHEAKKEIYKNNKLDDQAKASYLSELSQFSSTDAGGNLRVFSPEALPEKFKQSDILKAMEKVPELQEFIKNPQYAKLGDTEKLTYLQKKGYTPEYLIKKTAPYISNLDKVQALNRFYKSRGIDYTPKLKRDMEGAAALLAGVEISKFREISQKGDSDGVSTLSHPLIYTEGAERPYGLLDAYKESKYEGISTDYSNSIKRIDHVQSQLDKATLPEDKVYYENALARSRASKNAMGTLKGYVDVEAKEGLKTDKDYLEAKNKVVNIATTAAPSGKAMDAINAAASEIAAELENDITKYPNKASFEKALIERLSKTLSPNDLNKFNAYGAKGGMMSGLNTTIGALEELKNNMLRVEDEAFDKVSSKMTETSKSRMVSTALNTKNYELAQADVPKNPNTLDMLNKFGNEGSADIVSEMKEDLGDGYTFKYKNKSLAMTGVRGEPITGATAVVTYEGKHKNGSTKTYTVRVPIGENMAKARNIANLKEIKELYGEDIVPKGMEQTAVNVLDEISPQLFRGIDSKVKILGNTIDVKVRNVDGQNMYYINGTPTGLNFENLQDQILKAVLKSIKK